MRLFERSTRRLALTPAGDIFYQHARRALEAVASTEVAVKNMGDVPRGVLRISAPLTFGRMYVAPLLPRLVERYPELDCELILTDQLVDLVEDGVDLALRVTRTPPDDVVARKLVALRRVICATPDYLSRQGEPRSPNELIGHACFSYLPAERNNVWRLADRNGDELSVPVGSKVQFNNVDCVLDAVLAGHGVAILPTYLCGPQLAAGRLRSLLDDYEPITGFGRYLYACYTPSRVRVPKVRVFLDELEARFSPLPPWECAPSPAEG